MRSRPAYIIRRCAELYEKSRVDPGPVLPDALSLLSGQGCAEKGLDVTQGGAELSFTTLEAVTFATTVDSLLAVKYLVFDKKECTMAELIGCAEGQLGGPREAAGQGPVQGPQIRPGRRRGGCHGAKVMELWCEETWKHRTVSTDRQFRPGMLSWNYWVGDGFILPASPDGRPKGRFLSNAMCPSNGADINGPTANVNSVGKAMGGKDAGGPRRLSGVLQLPAQRREPHHHHQPLAAARPGAQGQVQSLPEGLYGKWRKRAADQHTRCGYAA